MKKSIVLGAALLLAGAAAFAADVKFSGRIRVGYGFQFGDTQQTTLKKNPEGRLNLSIADSDGLWSITFDQATDGGFSDHYYRARATVALDKALKGAGVDLGDVSLQAFGGYNDFFEVADAYDDDTYSDNDFNRIDLDVASNTKYASIVGVNVGYGDLVKVQAVSAPYDENGDNKTPSFAFAATSTPIDGIAVGAAYGHNVRLAGGNIDGASYNNAFGVSASGDVAKLIKEDSFKLGFGADFLYGLEDEDDGQDTFMQVMGRVSGGVDVVDGYVEYAYTTIDNDADFERQYLRAQVNLNVVDGLGLDVYYQDTDLTDEEKKDNFEVGAESSYKFGGVVYHLDVAYIAEKDNDNFKVTPWVQIAF